MFASKEVASRRVPVGHSRATRSSDASLATSSDPKRDLRRSSESRLQVAIAPKSTKRDESDPYADVPCTD